MLNLETSIVCAMARQFHRLADGTYGPIDPAAVAAAQTLRYELERTHGVRLGSIYTKWGAFSSDPATWSERQVRQAIASGLDWGPHKLSGAAPLECSAD